MSLRVGGAGPGEWKGKEIPLRQVGGGGGRWREEWVAEPGGSVKAALLRYDSHVVPFTH